MTSQDIKSRHRRFLKFLLIKFPIFILIVMGIFAFALKMIERYPDPIRQGLEEYISNASNTNASIGKMEEFTFLPTLKADLSDINFHDQRNAANIVGSIDHIRLAAPFFSGVFGGKKIKALSVENITVQKAALLPSLIKIESIEIEDEKGLDQYGSYVVGRGYYGSQNLNFMLGLDKRDKYYVIPKNIPFSFILGNKAVEGTMTSGFRTMTLENTVYSSGGKNGNARAYKLIDDREYVLDNPISCLLLSPNLNECDRYLKE